MTTEVDLSNQDGVIISSAAVDDTLWAQQGPQITALATSKGFYVDTNLGDPPERNVNSWADASAWINGTAAADNTTYKAAASTSTTSKVLVIGAAVAAGLGLLALFLSTRPKS
jgi:hypothetical protein